MPEKEEQGAGPNKELAAVCGLYCEACILYIATTEDPERLKRLSERFQLPEEVMKCYGCRSSKRGPYCQTCKMLACAAEKKIDFCFECDEYPCDHLKEFQAERPHRIELWEDLERIREIGFERWLSEAGMKYACSKCETINSAYDMKCRKCGEDPSCGYVSKHKQAIEPFLKDL